MDGFQVTVAKDDFDDKMFSISVTHNGSSWSTIRVTKGELLLVAREVLQTATKED